jgi:hypothetical protein
MTKWRNGLIGPKVSDVEASIITAVILPCFY